MLVIDRRETFKKHHYQGSVNNAFYTDTCRIQSEALPVYNE
jgi:hypothetical protein